VEVEPRSADLEVAQIIISKTERGQNKLDPGEHSPVGLARLDSELLDLLMYSLECVGLRRMIVQLGTA
jgi:hypothetical protein